MGEFVVERKTLDTHYTRHNWWPLSDYSICTLAFIFPVDLREESRVRVRKSNHIYCRAMVARKLLTHCSANPLTPLKEYTYIRRNDARGIARDSIFFSRSRDVTMRPGTKVVTSFRHFYKIVPRVKLYIVDRNVVRTYTRPRTFRLSRKRATILFR